MNTAEIVTRFPQREDGTISITPNELHHVVMDAYRSGERAGEAAGAREYLASVVARHPANPRGGKLPEYTISRR